MENRGATDSSGTRCCCGLFFPLKVGFNSCFGHRRAAGEPQFVQGTYHSGLKTFVWVSWTRRCQVPSLPCLTLVGSSRQVRSRSGPAQSMQYSQYKVLCIRQPSLFPVQLLETLCNSIYLQLLYLTIFVVLCTTANGDCHPLFHIVLCLASRRVHHRSSSTLPRARLDSVPRLQACPPNSLPIKLHHYCVIRQITHIASHRIAFDCFRSVLSAVSFTLHSLWLVAYLEIIGPEPPITLHPQCASVEPFASLSTRHGRTSTSSTQSLRAC